MTDHDHSYKLLFSHPRMVQDLRRAFTVWIKRVLLPARLPGIELPEMSDLNEVQTSRNLLFSGT